MRFWYLLEIGGPVVWFILVGGVVALLVFLERSLSLHRARIDYSDFLRGIFNCLERERSGGAHIREALTLCDETPGPVAYMVKMAIQRRDAGLFDLDRTLQDTATAEISRMERRLVVIAMVAQIVPLLGLLGTFLGIMEGVLLFTVDGPLVQSVQLQDALLLSLSTTIVGLMVAIPCYAAFNMLVIKIDRIVLDMERTRYEMTAFLQEYRQTT